MVSVSTVEKVQRAVIIRRSTNSFQMEEQKSVITVHAIAIITNDNNPISYTMDKYWSVPVPSSLVLLNKSKFISIPQKFVGSKLIVYRDL